MKAKSRCSKALIIFAQFLTYIEIGSSSITVGCMGFTEFKNLCGPVGTKAKDMGKIQTVFIATLLRAPVFVNAVMRQKERKIGRKIQVSPWNLLSLKTTVIEFHLLSRLCLQSALLTLPDISAGYSFCFISAPTPLPPSSCYSLEKVILRHAWNMNSRMEMLWKERTVLLQWPEREGGVNGNSQLRPFQGMAS